MSPK
jgi:hypothetical protein